MVERRSFPKHAILYVMAIAVLLSPVIGLGATIDVYPGDKIQDAVNSASAGDTIIVHTGTYTENIEVKKQLTIKNAGDGGVTVNAKKGSDPCIIIKSSGSGSTIQGLTLAGATSDDGVRLDGADSCHIKDNHIRNNGHFGIHSTGVGNTISGNTISSNGKDGVYSEKSSQTAPTTISGNTIEGNGNFGIHAKQDYNQITGNNITDSGEDGVKIEGSYNPIANNQITDNGNFGIHSTEAGNTISGNTISSNGKSSGKDGIYSEKSSQTAPTTISGNTIEANGKYGIHAKQDYNHITGNTISDNGDHNVYSEGAYNHISTNTLKNTQPIGKDAIHITGDNNIISDNTIDNIQQNGIYINGKQNKIFGSSPYTQSISNCAQPHQAGIRLSTGNSPLQSKDNNEVYNNVLKKNFTGIHVLLSSSNQIHDNRVIEHHQGISLRDSALNDIYGNIVKWNKEFGILIQQVVDFRWNKESNSVHNNTIAECLISGIFLENLNLFKEQNLNNIYENHISLCGFGIDSLRDNASSIHDNTIEAVAVGIGLQLSKDTIIFQNRIAVDLIGLWFMASSSDNVSFNSISSLLDALVNTGISTESSLSSSSDNVSFNSISSLLDGHMNTGISTESSLSLFPPGNVTAEYNWWGSNDDPGSQIKGANVDYTPYLVLSADANPEKIYDFAPLNTSTITADLSHDSSGNYHDPEHGHVPDGIRVAFEIASIPRVGSLNPLEPPTSSGSATSTFTATDIGDADITAAAGWQTVHTSVKVDALSFLSITKTASSDPVKAGQDIIYTIKVHNSGPSQAENVQLTDAIPPYLNNVRYSLFSEVGPWQNWPPGSGYVDLETIPVDHVKSVWIIGSVDPGTPNGTLLTNSSSVTSTTYPDPVSTSITTGVVTVARVALEKTVDYERPNVGDRVLFEVTATNNGPSDAQHVLIEDVMPSAFADVVITPLKGSYHMGVWSIPSLAVNERATLRLEGTVTQEMECKFYINFATTKVPNALRKVVSASITVTCPVPTVTTQAVTGIGATTATGNGNITDLGYSNPTQHGVCWNTTGIPTIADNKTEDGPVGVAGPFTSPMTGLSPNTTYYVRAYATNSVGTAYGDEVSFTTNTQTPTVTTQAVSGIGNASADGNGNITDLGSPNPTQHGVCWNTSGTPTTADSKTEEGSVSATGPFTSHMTGLSSDITYYVRAYATNGAGTSYGNEVSFATRSQAATVTTQAVTNIGTTTADGNGNITDLGSPPPTQHGVCWNTTGTPTIADSKTEEGPVGATGPFVSHMTGLSPDTTYYVRAYATDTVGTFYGHQVCFTTSKEAPTVTTQAVSGIGNTSADGNGNITDLGSPPPTQHGVCWNTSGTPTTADSKTEDGPVGATGPFVSHMTGLSPDTTYYVRAYATNAAETSYGNEVSFTTSEEAPTVTTETVSGIGNISANGNGNITDLGFPDPTQHGVCWNTTGTPTIAGSKTEDGSVSATGPFVSHMTGLSSDTTYYVRAYAINPAGIAYGTQVSFTTSAQAPAVTTQAISGIGNTSADGNGDVTDLGSPPPIQHGVCWNTTGTPTIAGSKTEEGPTSTTGPFVSHMTGLSPNITYYVRAYATNAAGTSYGNEVSFITRSQAATVTTQAVTNIGTTTATGNGNITDLGSPPPTQHGICWSATGTPTIAGSRTRQGPVSSTGAFTSNMTGLTPNTTYYVRAYATDAIGTFYGNEVSFTTSKQAPTITDFNPKSGGPGTIVIIIGTNFTSTDITVKFGNTHAYSFTVDTTTQIRAVVGHGATGKVTVTTDDGTATSVEDFMFDRSIPTLNEWGMILFGLLLLGATAIVLQKRRGSGCL
ncbi:MAG: IPTL-CTERM sorting domain-containing protein [Deltaproteobacteria bacterium]|nr:IPTL-CTERM sorting domain-containing protein [Deltaproteobacteria bacterium]